MQSRNVTRLVAAGAAAMLSAYIYYNSKVNPPTPDTGTTKPDTSDTTKPDKVETDLSKVTYQWVGDMIKTSDGRTFPLKRENLVDDKGKPIIILEARSTEPSDAPPMKAQARADMDEAELTKDFWLRLQDQNLTTLELIPSKFDDNGDLRRTYVTITDSESDFLKLSSADMYRIKDGLQNKIAVPIWLVLKHQQQIQEVPIKPSIKPRVKALRQSEIPTDQLHFSILNSCWYLSCVRLLYTTTIEFNYG